MAALDEDYQQPAISKRYGIITADPQVVNCEDRFGHQQIIHIPLSMQIHKMVFNFEDLQTFALKSCPS
jgi:hypothetical protein